MRLQRQINKLNEEVSQLGNAIMLVRDYLEKKICSLPSQKKKKNT